MTNRLAVCLPQLDVVRREYAMSLAGMMLRLGNVPSGMDQVFTIAGNGSILPGIRHGIAKRAIELFNATHLLWIDADHNFPPDTAHRLIAHHRPWVGINAASRNPPYKPTAAKNATTLMETTRNSKGLERAWRIGFGIVLVEARVFHAMEKPWFMLEYLEEAEGDPYRGEDIYFCEKAKKAGFHPMVDHDLTNETEHIGSIGLDTATLLEAM